MNLLSDMAGQDLADWISNVGGVMEKWSLVIWLRHGLRRWCQSRTARWSWNGTSWPAGSTVCRHRSIMSFQHGFLRSGDISWRAGGAAAGTSRSPRSLPSPAMSWCMWSDARALVQNCYDYDLITQKEAKIMMAALSERSIPVKQPEQDILRAKILKNILVSLV